VTGQDLDETSTFTATATATGFASKEVDAKDQAQPEVSTKEDHSLEAETGCELEEKNLSHEMLTEVEGAYTTGDGEVSLFLLLDSFLSPSLSFTLSSNFLLLS